MAIKKDEQWHGATAVEWARGFLHVSFGDSGVRAKVHVRALANYLTLELTTLNNHTISEIHLVRVPLDITQTIGKSLTHCRNDDDAAALIPLNLETHSYVAPMEPAVPGEPIPGMVFLGARGHVGPQGDERPVLIAHADRKVGLDGAKVAVIACPTKSLLDIIEQIEIENGLPHPTIDGVWARRSPELMKSISVRRGLRAHRRRGDRLCQSRRIHLPPRQPSPLVWLQRKLPAQSEKFSQRRGGPPGREPQDPRGRAEVRAAQLGGGRTQA